MNTADIREQFPILSQRTPQGNPLIYLDNAATTQKPQVVIDAISGYYSGYNANVGRGTYWPANQSTNSFKEVRQKVRAFINASSIKECIFTSGTTDAINKVVNRYLLPRLSSSHTVIVSEMEHHGNFIAWQQACAQTGAQFKVIPITDDGDLDYDAYEAMLDDSVKMVAVTAVSNTLGTRNDIKRITKSAHKVNAAVLVDAAQWVTHESIDVEALNCDFLAFSAHKLFGPTGVGVLYGKAAHLEEMEPLSYGGGIVKEVRLDKSIFAGLPEKHEGGTANIAGVIGLGAAIDFVNNLGLKNIHEHTRKLTCYAADKIESLDGMSILGKPNQRASLLSIVVDGVHPHDVASFLSERGIAVRAGHHCTHPLMHRLQVPGTCRISFGVYNTRQEVDELIKGLIEVRDFFA